MKLSDINETVFNTLSPEVQAALIESASTEQMIQAVVIVALIWLFAWALI